MIKKHNSLMRAERILNSFNNSTYYKENLDGVIEAFKQKDKQGYVLKIYKSYDPEQDVCLWIYEEMNNQKIYTIQGTRSNCDELNNFIGADLIVKEYPIKTNIKKEIIKNLVDSVYSYYNKRLKL